jgi:hypothetical protein
MFTAFVQVIMILYGYTMTSVAAACLILNRILNSLQLAFLVHGYYLDGITNFGNFVADLRASPWCV